MVLEEDFTKNRLDDDVALFTTLIASPFLPLCWIFFQNKCDNFKSKVESGNLLKMFPNLGNDALDLQFGLNWHKTKFSSVVPTSKTVLWHITCATDKKKMTTIIETVVNYVLDTALTVIGLL
eukprot:TRINITY_DN703_c0_g1_i15.p1 TRINITY_DN703_c0_g1~~TRINITY_DN703_c0_g1_i15.p1  ORF type:complete len:122 (+),score=26.53 TRINITY_DN703_c0_g1_i15:851-1216(+)